MTSNYTIEYLEQIFSNQNIAFKMHNEKLVILHK